MPRLVNWLRNWEFMLVEDLQKVRIQWSLPVPEISLTFMKAYSFSAARRDIYIHDADFRLPM